MDSIKQSKSPIYYWNLRFKNERQVSVIIVSIIGLTTSSLMSGTDSTNPSLIKLLIKLTAKKYKNTDQAHS